MAKTISVKYQMTANTVKITVKDEQGQTHTVTSKRTGPGSFKGGKNETEFEDVGHLPDSVVDLASHLDWIGVCSYLKYEA